MPFVYQSRECLLVLTYHAALHSLTAEEQKLPPANCLALRMLFGVVGELYDDRYDYFVQQLDSNEHKLLGLQPLEVMQYVEAVYGSRYA